MNVTHIAGSLNVPQMFSFYVTNFTTQQVHTLVESGKEASFEYPFLLDPSLAGHEFQLSVTAFYEDESETYASTFYNSTIAVNDPVGVFATQTFVVKLVLLGIVAAVAYAGVSAAGAMPAVEKSLKKAIGSGTKKQAAPKRETGTAKNFGKNEWLQGTSFKEGKAQ